MRTHSFLVPGGAGFLGSHLCERLLADGNEVHALDDLSSGTLGNLDTARSHRRFAFTRSDIVLPLPASLERVDGIFNLACPASPPRYQNDPIHTTLTSCVGVWQLLEMASRCGATLLQASTSEIYGDPEVHPQPETYWGNVNPIGPRSCYDEGKRCAESLIYAYGARRGTDVRVARLFNSYGPRLGQGDGRVVSNFIAQALRGEPLTIHGNGQQTRSFCYIDDTVDAILALMQSDHSGPVNIGNPNETTILELAETVLRLTRSHSQLRHLPMPVDDPCRRCPDIGMARKVLGWQPRVALTDGLSRTIRYFEDTFGIGSTTIPVHGLTAEPCQKVSPPSAHLSNRFQARLWSRSRRSSARPAHSIEIAGPAIAPNGKTGARRP